MKHGNLLPLDRCPHCSVAMPSMTNRASSASADYAGKNPRTWALYMCVSCGGMVMAVAHGGPNNNGDVMQFWPRSDAVSESIPQRAREYLEQAIASIHAPAGALMLTASAVDAMLKEKGLKEGSLNTRIDTAAKTNLITSEMAAWAHEIRLDANDQRHADEEAQLPSATDATKAIEFARALAQFLYVLPARVARGRKT
jgi:hypothetical protein